MTKLLTLLCAILLSMNIANATEISHCNSVKFFHPFGVGSSADLLTRTVAEKLSKETNIPFVVETKPGGTPPGSVAGLALNASTPDGCTISFMNEGSYAFPTLPYPLNDQTFSFMTFMGIYPDFLFLMPGDGVKIKENNKEYTLNSLKSLIDYAKRNPGKLNYAAPSFFSSMCMYRLLKLAEIDMVKIPYKSEAEALIALKQDNIQLLCSLPIASKGLVASGDLKVVANTLDTRDSAHPHAPSIKEIGIKNFNALEFRTNAILAGPAGLDSKIIEYYSNLICKIMKEPELEEKLRILNIKPNCSTPAETRAFVNKRIELFKTEKF